MTIDILSNRFNELAEQLGRQSDAHAKATADAITAKMIATVPVDTSDLQSTIKPVKKGDAHYEVQAGDESAGIDYGVIIEYGGDDRAAIPFATPSAESERPNFIDRIVQDTF